MSASAAAAAAEVITNRRHEMRQLSEELLHAAGSRALDGIERNLGRLMQFMEEPSGIVSVLAVDDCPLRKRLQAQGHTVLSELTDFKIIVKLLPSKENPNEEVVVAIADKDVMHRHPDIQFRLIFITDDELKLRRLITLLREEDGGRTDNWDSGARFALRIRTYYRPTEERMKNAAKKPEVFDLIKAKKGAFGYKPKPMRA